MVASKPQPREVIGNAIRVVLSFIGPQLNMAVKISTFDADSPKVATMAADIPGVGVVQSSYTIDRVMREFNTSPDAFSIFVRDWLDDLEYEAVSRLKDSLGDSSESPG